MRRSSAVVSGFVTLVVGTAMMVSVGQAGDMSKGKALEMVLATAKAARTVFVKGVLADAKKGGVKPGENYLKSDEHIMLPAQFVKELGKQLKTFELGLVGTDPLYASNAPKTDKEKAALAELAAGKKKVVTFEDGGRTVGMSADFAIAQGCADCHNKHPKTTKKDWKKGDFMGAIVARIK